MMGGGIGGVNFQGRSIKKKGPLGMINNIVGMTGMGDGGALGPLGAMGGGMLGNLFNNAVGGNKMRPPPKPKGKDLARLIRGAAMFNRGRRGRLLAKVESKLA